MSFINFNPFKTGAQYQQQAGLKSATPAIEGENAAESASTSAITTQDELGDTTIDKMEMLKMAAMPSDKAFWFQTMGISPYIN